MGGPSEADIMKEAMMIITSPDPEITHDSKMTAFDNFEQCVENIDNANNLGSLGLWTPLIDLLDNNVCRLETDGGLVYWHSCSEQRHRHKKNYWL